MGGMCSAQVYPAASQNRRINRSPIDTLINLVVRSRLPCQIPVRLNVHPVLHLRTTVLPQRWPACRAYVRGFGLHPDVCQYLPDLHAVLRRDARAPPGPGLAPLPQIAAENSVPAHQNSGAGGCAVAAPEPQCYQSAPAV